MPRAVVGGSAALTSLSSEQVNPAVGVRYQLGSTVPRRWTAMIRHSPLDPLTSVAKLVALLAQ